MTALTIHLPDETAAKLDALAQRLERPQADLLIEAIEDIFSREASHLAEIEAGVAEAEQGDFATDEELAAVTKKFRGRRRSS